MNAVESSLRTAKLLILRALFKVLKKKIFKKVLTNRTKCAIINTTKKEREDNTMSRYYEFIVKETQEQISAFGTTSTEAAKSEGYDRNDLHLVYSGEAD